MCQNDASSFRYIIIVLPFFIEYDLCFSYVHVEKSEYAVTSNELKNQFDIPIQLFLSCIGYQ